MIWTTTRRHAAVLLGMLAALGAAACGGSSSTGTGVAITQGPACDTAGSTDTATTSSYRMVLKVGAVEDMYSQADISAVHPSSGQLMLSGSMADAMGPNARQVEVHICKASDGSVVTGASPQIVLTDATDAAAAPQTLAVAVMQAVNRGSNDLHYGNNATVTAGHAYTVTVTLDGEKATMKFAAS